MPEAFDVLAALIRVDRSPSLGLAARSLAAAGVPVFPCVVEGKRPLTRRGFLDASSDPEQVAAIGDFDAQPQLDLAQVRVERAGQIGQAFGVGRVQREFAAVGVQGFVLHGERVARTGGQGHSDGWLPYRTGH